MVQQPRTFPDGSTATLTGDKTVKEADSKGVQEPAAKTPVQNTSALTQPEKDAVKKAVEDANPTATKVEVGNDGPATVTFQMDQQQLLQAIRLLRKQILKVFKNQLLRHQFKTHQP